MKHYLIICYNLFVPFRNMILTSTFVLKKKVQNFIKNLPKFYQKFTKILSKIYQNFNFILKFFFYFFGFFSKISVFVVVCPGFYFF